MKFTKWIWLSVLLGSLTPAIAGINNPGSGSVAPAVPAAQVNLGGIDIASSSGGNGGAFINVMKTFSPTAVDPSQFDALQYPIGNGAGGAGSLSANYGNGWKIPIALQATSVSWIITWPATRTFSLVINQPVNITAKINCTSCTLGAGGTATIRSQGTAGSVTFNLNTGSPTNATVAGYFESGLHYNSAGQSGDIVFMRVSDQTAYNAGAIFRPEFIASLTGLNPKTIRPMGWIYPGSADYTNEVNWNYRTVPTALTYNGFQIRASTYGGSVINAGTTTYPTAVDQYTVPAALDTPLGSWVDGEVLQGNMATTASSTITGAVASDASNCASIAVGKVCLTVNTVAALASSQSVVISGVVGTTEANGSPTITVVDSTHIALQFTTFTHAYVSGGSIASAPTKITITGSVAADVSHCSSVTAGLVCLTVNSSSTLTTNQSVWINGLLTSSGSCVSATADAANGIRAITVIDATHIAVQAINFTNAFCSGGFVGTQTLTVTGKTGGAKFISDAAGYPLWTQGGADALPASGFVTFIYDKVLDRVLAPAFGIVNTVPIEVMVSLSNQLNSNLWLTIPAMANDAYVSSMVAYPISNLNAALTLYLEYGNEIWNNGFPLTQWSYNHGLAIGWPDTGDEPLHGWYGSRYSQIMTNVTTQWTSGRGNLSKLKRVIAGQAYGRPAQTIPQRVKGALLNVANAPNYATYFSTDYSIAPNRPFDRADLFSYATYYSGSSLTQGGFYTAGQASLIATLQSIATNYAAGGSGITTALAAIDADIRCVSFACTGPNANNSLWGLSTHTSDANLANGVYPTWVATMASNSVVLPVENYEGGLETLAPTLAQCTAMAITAPPLGGGAPTNQGCTDQLTAALAAYKNSAAASQLVLDQFTQARAGGIVTPSWLSVSGPSQWSFYPDDIYDSTAYQTYSGFASFH